MHDSCGGCRRRQLLGAGATGTAALLVSACSSALATSTDAGSSGDGDPPEDTGAGGDGGVAEVSCSACPTSGKVVVLTFAEFPTLRQVGGSLLHEVPGYTDPVCQADFILVAQPSAGQFVAVSASCTHQCCTVTFSGSGFDCPCHGSAFALDGRVTRGPAARSLQKLAVCANECGVTVTIP
jgi:Rieske Fe-S protein